MADPQHITLTANTVSTVTLAVDASIVEIVNIDGAAVVYATVDGSTPAVGGEGAWVLPAAICSRELKPRTAGRTVVKLISAGTPMVSVGVIA